MTQRHKLNMFIHIIYPPDNCRFTAIVHHTGKLYWKAIDICRAVGFKSVGDVIRKYLQDQKILKYPHISRLRYNTYVLSHSQVLLLLEKLPPERENPDLREWIQNVENQKLIPTDPETFKSVLEIPTSTQFVKVEPAEGDNIECTFDLKWLCETLTEKHPTAKILKEYGKAVMKEIDWTSNDPSTYSEEGKSFYFLEPNTGIRYKYIAIDTQTDVTEVRPFVFPFTQSIGARMYVYVPIKIPPQN